MNVYAQLSGTSIGSTVVAIVSTTAVLASPIHVQIASEASVELGATWNGGTSFTNPTPPAPVIRVNDLWVSMTTEERGLFLDMMVAQSVITSERRTALAAKVL